jgi:uncharacterized protein (DUF433 family)
MKRFDKPYSSRVAKHIISSVLDWANCEGVERSEDVVNGAWVFQGTRVPVRALFENLESGATIDQFLDWFNRPNWPQLGYRSTYDHQLAADREKHDVVMATVNEIQRGEYREISVR